MAKLKNLFSDIQFDLEQDINPLDIAKRLDIPITWVYEVSESIQDFEELDDSGWGE
jgi:hypothetical protein